MIVIVKEPGMVPEIRDVKDLVEINEIVGNVDENEKGYDYAGGDTRDDIGECVNMYCNEWAQVKKSLGENVWLEGIPYSSGEKYILSGTVVFAGYNQNSVKNYGACSLTLDQIVYCVSFIEKHSI